MLDGEDISWIDTGFDVNDLRAGGRGFGWCYACHGCSCSGRSIKIAVL